MADEATVITETVIEQPPPDTGAAPVVTPDAAAPPERKQPSIEDWNGLDWSAIPEDKRAALKTEMDRRIKAAKQSARNHAKRELEAFHRGAEFAAPKKEAPAPVAVDQPPTRDQFDSYEAFIDAKAEFTGRRAAREDRVKSEQEATQRREQEAVQKRTQDFQTKVRTKYPDIDTRLEDIGDAPIHGRVKNALTESEFGAEIFNELVGKPKEFERLYQMTEDAAIREIGKLEARYESAAKKPEPVKEAKPSSAPNPINPVGGKAVSGDGEPSHDNPEAWAAWRNRQIHARKKGNGASR